MACACANANAVLRVGRSASADVDGVDRGDAGARVPGAHVNVRVRGARSNGARLQKSLTPVPARKEAAALRAVTEARAGRR